VMAARRVSCAEHLDHAQGLGFFPFFKVSFDLDTCVALAGTSTSAMRLTSPPARTSHSCAECLI